VSQNWRLRGHLCSGKHIHSGITENVNEDRGAALQAGHKQPGDREQRAIQGFFQK
jgi:hypothetical protein